MGREGVHWHAHDDLVRGRKADGILRSSATTVSSSVRLWPPILLLNMNARGDSDPNQLRPEKLSQKRRHAIKALSPPP